LNEAAYTGVDLVNNLLELLIKIRADQYLVLSDIRSAFLMIRLNLISDRNKFTILWLTKDGVLKAFRYKTIVFGFTSSPFILQRVIQYHLSKYAEDKCLSLIKDGMYVDNLFYTGDNPDEMLTSYRESLSRMSEGGFNLRSWATNCSQLAETFAADGSSASPSNSCEKVLGYRYFPDDDLLRINEFDTTDNDTITKRSVLSYISRIFDPLGLVLPVLAKAKLFMKTLWSLKLGWDEPLNAELLKEWSKIKTDLNCLPNYPLARCAYGAETTLYIFCDSSKSMYGFVCYAVNGQGDSHLLFAKSKVSPAKAKSLPTLELMAVYLAFKCLPCILNSVKASVRDVVVCVDAQVVLSWVLSGNVKSKNICAKNRVKDISKFRSEIRESHDIECRFKYIPTNLNPADLLTRGISSLEFDKVLKFWLSGPDFLSVFPIIWPADNLGCLSEQDKVLTMATAATQTETIMPVNRYSNLNKLHRVTALVIKFISKLRKKIKSELTCANEAKIYWIKKEQSSHFNESLTFLNNPSRNIPTLVNNLNLYLDSDGIIRSKGRLERCHQFSSEAKNPILIPKESFLTQLYIEDSHFRCKHLGVASTLASLRKSGLWIPKGRCTVKKVLDKCIVCKKINCNAFSYPKPNDFVDGKVNFEYAYQNTGIDFTGHIYVKLGDKLCKMYILLYTCLNIRAIHLEILPDMSVKQFLLSFVRFTNRFGIPRAVFSDNASSFLAALGILANSTTDNPFLEHLVRNNIRHIKIPLYAAWVGSAWERMIRTMKSCIHKSVGRKHLDYFDILTLLSDIQDSVNNRPLTYYESDPNFACICPNSFLISSAASRGTLLLSGAPTRKDLIKTLERRDDTLDAMKERWTDEYLLGLREASREMYEADWEDQIKLGEVVLISAPNKSRTHWQLGKVIELLPGQDHKIRTVKLRRHDKSEGVYSIKNLYPLEIRSDEEVQNIANEPAPLTISTRPQRVAAINCRNKLKFSN